MGIIVFWKVIKYFVKKIRYYHILVQTCVEPTSYYTMFIHDKIFFLQVDKIQFNLLQSSKHSTVVCRIALESEPICMHIGI